MHRTRGLGIEREGELFLPVEGVARVADGIVAIAGAGAVAGDVRSVGGDLVGDHAVLHVLLIGEAQVLLGRDVAEHAGAVPADERRADGAGDVVVAGRDVGNERAQRIEGRSEAVLDFLVDLLLDLVERDVARAFDHDLDVALPGFGGELAEGLQLGELGLVRRVGD